MPSGVDLLGLHLLKSDLLCAAAGGTRERPWSAILTPEDHTSLTLPSSRRHTSLMAFHGNSLSKSLSISNIAGYAELPHVYVVMVDRNGLIQTLLFSLCYVFPKFCFYRPTFASSFFSPMFDEIPIKSLRHLSQSTDSLNRSNQVTESMESLTDEGANTQHSPLMRAAKPEPQELSVSQPRCPRRDGDDGRPADGRV